MSGDFSFCKTCKEEYDKTPKGAHNPSLLLISYCYFNHNYIPVTPNSPGYPLCDGREQVALEDVYDYVWKEIDTWLDPDDLPELFTLLHLKPMYNKEKEKICSKGLLGIISYLKEKELGMHTLNYFIYTLRQMGFLSVVEDEIMDLQFPMV